jgi:hypothetical protein
MAISRKFYNVLGLHKVFTLNGDQSQYVTGSLRQDIEEVVDGYITADTILFVTADSTDEGKQVAATGLGSFIIKAGDSFIWAKGAVKCVSGSNVRDIIQKSDGIYAVMSDGSEKIVNTGGGGTAAEGHIYDSAHDSLAEGVKADLGSINIASGNRSHAEGVVTRALGDYSHSEGASTQAEGAASHVEGSGCIGLGLGSHAEGFASQAEGYASHAEGNSVQAKGYISHAEGIRTQAIGEYSHAEGYETHAAGDNSHVSGSNTIAYEDNMFVCGKYNDTSLSGVLFAVGNGDSTTRSNGFYVTTDAQAYAGSWQTISDERLKDIKGEVSKERAYRLVTNCEPIEYVLKSNPNDNQVGLVAQQVKEVFPELVKEDSNGYLSIDYARTVAVLLKVVKDLNERLTALERVALPG